MASALQPAPDSPLPLYRPRTMTRCECAGVAFAEIAREVLVAGRPLDQVLGRTGCGGTCGACRPDLADYLAALSAAGAAAARSTR